MFWIRFIRRVYATLGFSLWSLDAAGRVLEYARQRHPFPESDLDPGSLSILRQCFPGNHPFRRVAEQALKGHSSGPPIRREELLRRLTSVAAVDEGWVLSQWRLCEGTPPLPESLERAFLPRIRTFLSRLLLTDLAGQHDDARQAWLHVVGWFLEHPDTVRPLSGVLFRHVFNELSSVPASVPHAPPSWFAEMSGEERRFVLACLHELDEGTRAMLYLSFYAGLTAEQIRRVVSGPAVRSIEDVVAQLEGAYRIVLEGMVRMTNC